MTEKTQSTEQIIGTPEIDQLVDLVVAGYKAVQAARADGKIDVSDAGLLLTLIPLIGPAVVGLEKAPAELMDLTTEEGLALLARASGILGEQPEKVKEIAEGVIQMVAGGIKVYKAVLS